MKHAKHSGAWQYLEACGVLTSGTPADIQAARKEYWRDYKRKWKAEQRKTFTVSLNSAETAELYRSAKAHHAKPTAFLKCAALAYMRSSFVVPDPEAVSEIRLLLARNYLLLQTMCDEACASFDPSVLLARFEKLESEVMHLLTQPKRGGV